MADKIQIRRDTASNWTSVNPTLASGELGIETDTTKMKVGTGSTAWTSLGYVHTVGIADYAPLAGATFTGAVSGTTFTGATVNASTALQIGGTAITSTPAELNLLDGVTATTAELNYTDGVTSNIQTQIDSKSTGQLASFVASGAIASGKPVVLNTNGTVSEVSGDLRVLGPQTSVISADSSRAEELSDDCVAWDPVNNKVVCVYNAYSTHYPMIVVGSISGTPAQVTWGTPVRLDGSSSTIVGSKNPTICYSSTSGRYVVAFHTSGSSWGETYIVVGTYAATDSVTLGSKVQILSGSQNYSTNHMMLAPVSNNQVVFGTTTSINSGSGQTNLNLMTLSGSGTSATVTAGTDWANVFSNTNANCLRGTIEQAQDRIVLIYSNAGAKVSSKIGTFSGTGTSGAITLGSTIGVGSTNNRASAADIARNTDGTAGQLFVYSNTASSAYSDRLYCRYGTYAATNSLTLGPEGTIDVTTTGATKHIYSSAGVTVAYSDGTGDEEFIVVYSLEEADGIDNNNILKFAVVTIDGTGASATPIISNKTEILTGDSWARPSRGAICNADDGRTVIIYRVSADSEDNTVIDKGVYSKVLQSPENATNIDLTGTNYIGIADEAIANGATGNIMVKGGLSTKQSGLTIGSEYYIRDDGTFNTSSSGTRATAGKALTATTLMMKGH